MNRIAITAMAAASAVALMTLAVSGTVSANAQTGALVRLQPSSPGTVQTGNLNISGIGRFGDGLDSGPSTFTAAGAGINLLTFAPFAIRGLNPTTINSSVGVLGDSNGLTGQTWGVVGQSDSTVGRGVGGFANHATGVTYGLFGQTTSPNGTAVYGSTTGTTTGWGGHFLGRGYFRNNLGLGTTTPNFPLSFANSTGSKISLWGQTTAAHYGFGIQSTLLQIYTDILGSDIAFGYGSSTAFTENVRIKGNGNVGIGTNAPDGKLDVEGSVRTNNFDIYLRAGTDTNHGLGWYGPSPLKGFGTTGFVPDGPVLYGFNGGGLGTTNGGSNIALSWNSLGNVGIGTVNPTARLEVVNNSNLYSSAIKGVNLVSSNNASGVLGMETNAGTYGVLGIHPGAGEGAVAGGYSLSSPVSTVLTSTVDHGGQVFTYSSGPGHIVAYLSHVATFPTLGAMGLSDPSNGAAKAGFYVQTNGQSVMYANVKNFREPNPRDEKTEIVYGCLEGPENAAYIRGTTRLVQGQGHITLPEHFQDVAVLEGMTVQLTPLSGQSKGLAVVKKSLDGGIDVVELNEGKGDYEFDYMVSCVRRGQENHQVIQPRMRIDAKTGLVIPPLDKAPTALR